MFLFRCWCAALLLAALSATAAAQDFPSRPITLVVSFPPGSITDNVSRALAAGMQDTLGQPVLVENRAGAQGVIGSAYVARAKPDGYTLLMASSTVFIGPTLYKNVPYDPATAFQPVSGVGSTSMMIMVNQSSPVRSIDDLVKAAKAQPGTLTVGYGSPSAQVMLSLLASTTGAPFNAVSYKGTPQALIDLNGGQLAGAVVDVSNGVAQLPGGKLRALGISARARTAAAPDVPILSEQYPDMVLETIITAVAPAGTPQPVVDKLDAAIRASLAKPEVKARFAAMTTETLSMSSAELTQFLKTHVPRWDRLVKAAGIEPQ